MSGGIAYMGIKANCQMCDKVFTITQLEQKYCTFLCKRAAIRWRKGGISKAKAVDAQRAKFEGRREDWDEFYCEVCNDWH